MTQKLQIGQRTGNRNVLFDLNVQQNDIAPTNMNTTHPHIEQ